MFHVTRQAPRLCSERKHRALCRVELTCCSRNRHRFEPLTKLQIRVARAPRNHTKIAVSAAVWRALTLFAAALLAGCGVVGATPDDRELQVGPFGRVEFNLDLPNGEHIEAVDLHLVCTGLDQHHQVDVTDGALVAAFGGLTPGACHVDISATSDQDTACLGEKDFSVVAGQTSEVTVIVLCQGRDESPSGSVRFSVDFDFYNCSVDRISTVEADPGALSLGESTTIAVDAYPEAVIGTPDITFSLSNHTAHPGEGTLSVSPFCASLGCVQVTCTGVGGSPVVDPASSLPSGILVVAVTLEDDECFHTEAIEITCLASSVCGDLLVTDDEQCDDGNSIGGDGCSSQCAHEYCDGGAPDAESCDVDDGLIDSDLNSASY